MQIQCNLESLRTVKKLQFCFFLSLRIQPLSFQSSRWERELCLLYFNCVLLVVVIIVYAPSSRSCRLVCGLWMWTSWPYSLGFVFVLSFFFCVYFCCFFVVVFCLYFCFIMFQKVSLQYVTITKGIHVTKKAQASDDDVSFKIHITLFKSLKPTLWLL